MTPDYRALCAAIIRASDAVGHDAAAAEGDFLAAIDNARAALAAEQQGPQDDWFSVAILAQDMRSRGLAEQIAGDELLRIANQNRAAFPEPTFTPEEVELHQAPWSYLSPPAAEPQGPTDDAILLLAAKAAGYERIESADDDYLAIDSTELVAFARAVLARWGAIDSPQPPPDHA